MQVRTNDNPERSRFEVYADGDLVGFADYRLQGDVMSLPHTEVQSQYRGRGLASALIKSALDAARSRGLTVLPLCPFVSRYIGENPTYLPLVPEDQRTRFRLG
jgi:uncharacterized protein